MKIDMTEWKSLMNDLCNRIRALQVFKEKKYKYVFGVPRGGLPIAVYVAEKLKLILVETPVLNETIVVDDLIDSNATREKYKDYDFEVLIDKRKLTNPQVWINFFYEDQEKDDKDLVMRIAERLGVKL